MHTCLRCNLRADGCFSGLDVGDPEVKKSVACLQLIHSVAAKLIEGVNLKLQRTKEAGRRGRHDLEDTHSCK